MNYVIAGLIITVWVYVAMTYSWSPNSSLKVNIACGILAILLLWLVHWIPFWLIFLK